MSHRLWLDHLLCAAQNLVSRGHRPVFFDVGARDGLSSSWDLLARLGLIEAYGFEPDDDHCRALQERDPHVRYFPMALAEASGDRTLYMTCMAGCSSLREPNAALLSAYPVHPIFKVVATRLISVTTIDEVLRRGIAPTPDFIKIDTQGSDLEVLQGAGPAVLTLKGIETETQLKPLYKGQALFTDVKAFLECNGHILRSLRPNGPYEGEFFEADAFFSPRPALNDNLDLIRLWQLATELDSPLFLSQMDDWLPAWRTGLTPDHMRLRHRLFGQRPPRAYGLIEEPPV